MRRWLGWFALAVIIGMQAGTVFKPLGTVGETRVADWVDLLTPFAILGCAAMVLVRAGRIPRPVGAVRRRRDHASPSATACTWPRTRSATWPTRWWPRPPIVHLWDEVVSHYIWYTGLFLVMAAMAWALRDQEFRVGGVDVVVALLVAVTLVNTYIEGGVPWLGLAFLGVGRRLRAPVAAGGGVPAAARRGRGRAACCSSGGASTGSPPTARCSRSSASSAGSEAAMHAADLREHLLREGISRRVVDVMMSVPRDRFVPPGLALPGVGGPRDVDRPRPDDLPADGGRADDRGRCRRARATTSSTSARAAATRRRCSPRAVRGCTRSSGCPTLADRARATLAELGYDVDVTCGDGSAGLPGQAPFDAIVVAAATPTVPPALRRAAARARCRGVGAGGW